MTLDATRERLDWLSRAAAEGTVHTVRVSWSDRLGVWRGKRIPVEDFLRSPQRRIGFCDGMIVVDVACAIIQETPFSNFETGYPDMYVQPELDTLRPVPWSDGEAFVLGELQGHHGEALTVAPRNVLRSVLARLAARGVHVETSLTLTGRLMRSPRERVVLSPGGLGRGETGRGALRTALEGLVAAGVPVRSLDARPDGTFRIALGALDPVTAGDLAVVTKAACKEVALRGGLNAVFMTRVPGAEGASQLEIGLALDGVEAAPEPERLAGALGDVRALLQPSITAFKAGPPPAPAVVDEAGSLRITGLRASSEADPLTALAATIAAVGTVTTAGTASDPVPSRGLFTAADRLAAASWATDWLGMPFLENAVPLLRAEAQLFADAVTDWEIERYWMQG